MRLRQELWRLGEPPQAVEQRAECSSPQLVLAFGAPALLRDRGTWAELRARWPEAALVACSTAGEICGTRVLDETMAVTAIQFEKTRVRCESVELDQAGSSAKAGEMLAQRLREPELSHVFMLSDGLRVNGSELVSGMTSQLPPEVAVTGGLAGDGPRFERTYVYLNQADDAARVVGVGLYGSSLRVGFGSLGGWDPFGPERRVTRAESNVLYELDGRPALDLYEEYLGEHAGGLPASGLLFPLTVRSRRDEPGVVRTILSVDRASRSLTYAGDIPDGCYARLMRANFDRLLDGAIGAAQTSHQVLGSEQTELAILISCVGRKLVLKQRIEEEVEGVQGVLGGHAILTGFYSYGELSPFTPSARCELHNQTMTITALSEV